MQPDIIPYIYKPTGVMLTDDDGMEYPELERLPGYHVNFLLEVPELSQYKLDPQPVTPHRIYAGGVTPVCYKFPDEQTFKQYFPDGTEEE
ncbi:hypothetical protein [Sinomicrobium sp.]